MFTIFVYNELVTFSHYFHQLFFDLQGIFVVVIPFVLLSSSKLHSKIILLSCLILLSSLRIPSTPRVLSDLGFHTRKFIASSLSSVMHTGRHTNSLFYIYIWGPLHLNVFPTIHTFTYQDFLLWSPFSHKLMATALL